MVFYINPAFGQSILLISSGTSIYDNYKEEKAVKIKLTEDTWVNYKGRYGDFFRISNFFGKDKNYPYGIYDGYVSIVSVLDTATREEYEKIATLSVEPTSDGTIIGSSKNNENPVTPEVKTSIAYDIDNLFIGMHKSQAITVGRPSFEIADNNFKIDLRFDQSNLLSEIRLSGDAKDALAVDGFIKKQTEELINYSITQFGKMSGTNTYPSLLEINENEIYSVATWVLSGKKITIGVGEKDDLYYSSLIIKK